MIRSIIEKNSLQIDLIIRQCFSKLIGFEVLYIIIEILMEQRINGGQRASRRAFFSKQENKSQYQVTNYHYYQKYQLISALSCQLAAQFLNFSQQQQAVMQKIKELTIKAENFTDTIRKTKQEKKKKVRRLSDQIHKCYQCNVENCRKTYGSQSSFRAHLKAKHPSIYHPQKKGRKTTMTSIEADQ